MKYLKTFEEIEFQIYKENDYVLIKNYKSNYIPGKIVTIKYRKDYKLDIINMHTFILLKENGIKEYYDDTPGTSIERKLQRLKEQTMPVKITNMPCYDFASLYPTVQKVYNAPDAWQEQWLRELKRKKLIAERKAKLEKINSICQE